MRQPSRTVMPLFAAALLPAAKAVLPKVATRKAPAKARGPVAAKRKAGAARAH